MVKFIDSIKFKIHHFIIIFKRKTILNYNYLYYLFIIKILFLFTFLLFILFSLLNVIFHLKNKIKEFSNLNENNLRNNYLSKNSNQLINNFYDILPKLSLNNNNYISNYNEIFEKRELYINNINLTNEYIQFLRPINEEEEKLYNQKLYENIQPNDLINKTRTEQNYSFEEFYKLCKEEKFINSNLVQYFGQPLISVIVPSFNKGNIMRKSLLSIQNQSLKNIEIIIIDDCSIDNSKYIYKYLLDLDPRIRVITHLKNMGIWRTRIDGVLYSKGKYIIQFDMEDFYTDNYILEDAYNLAERYNLDSIRFSFIRSEQSENPYNNSEQIKFLSKYTKIMYGKRDFEITTWEFGTVWNRLIRANIIIKGLYLLDSYILNAYKNLWDDRWYNYLINKMSFSCLLINRAGYLYLPNNKGERFMRLQDDKEKDKTIREFIYFWLFDLEMLSKNDNKSTIIQTLKNFNSLNNTYMGVFVNLSYLKGKFEIYEHLLNLLINDPFVLTEDKKFVNQLLNNYKDKFQ